MLRDITVLLTGAGAPGAPGIIKCLKKNRERNIRLVGVDMNPDAGGKSLVDSFHVVPAADNDSFIDRILDICKRERVDIIQPIVTKELYKFAESKSMFAQENIQIAVMDTAPLRIANNKGKLLSTLREKGIPVPEFYIVNAVDEIEEACAKLGYPEKAVCVKPTEGNGSRGTRIVNPSISRYDLFFNSKPNSMAISYNEMLLTLRERESIPEMMVMEYLPGEEYSVDVLAIGGKVLAIVGRHNTVVVNSIPHECVLQERKEALQLCIQICDRLGLDGNIGFDFKSNESGNQMIMEINPRLTATIVACAAAGVNFPYLGIKKLLGELFDIPAVKYGTKMIRHWQEVFVDKNDQIINW